MSAPYYPEKHKQAEYKNPPDFGVGKRYCIECEGSGQREDTGLTDIYPFLKPEDKLKPCTECDGKGWMECEHQEYGDHNDCLDCGYDRTPDLMDQAKLQLGGPNP